MIPKTNSTEYQKEILSVIKGVYEFDSELSDRMILISIFDNYRTGGGLRLSKLGYKICLENSLYEFFPIQLKKGENSSTIFTSLDRVCTTPYYISAGVLYLSDVMIISTLTLCSDDFSILFSTLS